MREWVQRLFVSCFLLWLATVPLVNAQVSPRAEQAGNSAAYVGGPGLHEATPYATQSTTTVLSLLSGNNPSFTGSGLTFQATVSPAVSGGTVAFQDSGSIISGCGTQALSGSSTATCITSALTEGAHQITASYSGTTGFNASASNTFIQVVNNSTTTSGVTASSGTFCNPGTITIPTPYTAGGAKGSPATPYPSEIFVSGLSGLLNGVTITFNNWSSNDPLQQEFLLVGPTGGALNFLANAGGTSSSGAYSLSFADNGANGAVPASTGPTSGGTYLPTSLTSTQQTVFCQVSDLVSNMCDGALVSQGAPNAFAFAANQGMGTLTNQFSGSSPNGTWQLYAESISNLRNGSLGGWCLTFSDVNGDGTQMSLASSQNPSYTTAPTNAVTLTATITDVSNTGRLIGEGTVTFSDSGTPLGGCSTMPVAPASSGGGGTATCTASALTEGVHNLTATYSGTSNFGVSTANLVQRADNHTLASISGNTYTYCNPGAIRAPAGEPAITTRGPASPWPSNIFVTNLPGTVASLSVLLNDFVWMTPNELQMLLVGPANTSAQSFDFFSRLSSSNSIGNPATGSGGINLTIADSGASPSYLYGGGTFLPFTGASGDLYSMSTIGPSSSGPPVAPYNLAAPAGNFSLTSTNGVFGGGTNSTLVGDGTWSLYVEGQSSGSYGSLGDTSQAIDTNQPSWCLSFQVNVPSVSISVNHNPTSFHQGESGDTYTIQVADNGPGPAGGTMTVTDTLPPSMTAVSMGGTNGTGWSCNVSTLTCTRTAPLALSQSDPIILTVNVAANAPTGTNVVTNTATVSGSIATTQTANDPTTIIPAADLTVTKTHSGTFRQGDTADTYTITVTNSGPSSTIGAVTLIDVLPAGLSVVSMTGADGHATWVCTPTGLSCTTSAVLAPGSSYSPILLTVAVSASAPVSVTNTARVSGGGEVNTNNDTASDVTAIVQASDLAVTETHAGNFKQGDTGDSYTIIVSNVATAGSTFGTVTVLDSLPSGLTATAMSGADGNATWSCNLATLTCTTSAVLLPGSSYPAIALTVNVAANAPASVVNSVTVSGGGDLNPTNNGANDTTIITQSNYAPTVSVFATPTAVRYDDQYSGLHGLAKTGKWINGDTFSGFTLSNDGNVYYTQNDTWEGMPDANMQVGKASTDLLTFTSVNGMSEFGQAASDVLYTSAPVAPCTSWSECTWKSAGVYSVHGALYLSAGWSLMDFPYVGAAYTWLKSMDHGLTWCNPAHATAAGCSLSDANGDLPQPAQIMGNITPDPLSYPQIIQYCQDNANCPATDNNGTYTYVTWMDAQVTPPKIILSRVTTANLPALNLSQYQYYTGGDGSQDSNWSSNVSSAATLAFGNMHGRYAPNIVYLPGPQIYLSIQNYIVEIPTGSVIDTHVFSAPHPWGPWSLSGYWPSQPSNAAFQPYIVIQSETPAGVNSWSYKAVESGWWQEQHLDPDTNGYGPYIRTVTVSLNPPAQLVAPVAPVWSSCSTPRNVARAKGLDQAISDRSLYWFYAGEFDSNAPELNLYDLSSNGNNATPSGYGAVFDQHGMASFDGATTYMSGPQQNSGDATYFLAYRQCCSTPSSNEFLMGDANSSNGSNGISVYRHFTSADTWDFMSWGALDSAPITEVDGSYHLLILRQQGNTLSVYDSNSLNCDSTLTPIQTITATPTSGQLQTAFGARLGGSNFFRGTVALGAAYKRALADSEIASRITAVVAALGSPNRGVHLPMSYVGPYPLDNQPAPYAAYSVRRLLNSYNGPAVNVRRDSDGNMQDIGFTTTGDLDSNSLVSFCGSGNCYVDVFYDQSGHGLNATQGAIVYQPQIVSHGALLIAGGRPTIAFGGAQSLSTGTQSFSLTADAASVMTVASLSNSAGNAVAAFVGNPADVSGGNSLQVSDLFAQNSTSYQFTAFRYNGTSFSYALAAPQAAQGSLFMGASVFDGYSHRMYIDGVNSGPVPVTSGSTMGGE
ncbi:MAG: Ig-like domain repeat protein, partial [Acidobacteriaceae bacterium]|nr:Ig-like domain repeat protein [Acidobacteriaceae bacterium]